MTIVDSKREDDSSLEWVRRRSICLMEEAQRREGQRGWRLGERRFQVKMCSQGDRETCLRRVHLRGDR